LGEGNVQVGPLQSAIVVVEENLLCVSMHQLKQSRQEKTMVRGVLEKVARRKQGQKSSPLRRVASDN